MKGFVEGIRWDEAEVEGGENLASLMEADAKTRLRSSPVKLKNVVNRRVSPSFSYSSLFTHVYFT
jgi:hypothetical protein